jgi:hypothetical protein
MVPTVPVGDGRDGTKIPIPSGVNENGNKWCNGNDGNNETASGKRAKITGMDGDGNGNETTVMLVTQTRPSKVEMNGNA